MKKMPKYRIVSEDVKIKMDGQEFLLEKGDRVMINETSEWTLEFPNFEIDNTRDSPAEIEKKKRVKTLYMKMNELMAKKERLQELLWSVPPNSERAMKIKSRMDEISLELSDLRPSVFVDPKTGEITGRDW